MEPVYRTLTLRGATGKLRAARLHDKDYLVVPVTALVEGVIHPLGSKGRGEFVPRTVLKQSTDTWNGRPVVQDHPMDESGQLVSANLPTIYESQSFGMTFNAAFKNERELHMEAWLDPARAEVVGPFAKDVIEKVRAEQPVEVSVGGYVRYIEKPGQYHGQGYGIEWLQITSDHLAIGLSGGRGACSVDMGCGAMRGNADDTAPIYVLTPDAEGVQIVAAAWSDQPRVPAGVPDGGRWTGVDNSMHPQQVASFNQFEQWRAKVKALLESFSFRANTDGDPEIIPETPEADPNDNPAPPEPEAKAAGACSCQHNEEPEMHRNADKIKALIEDPKTPFTADDQAFLEGLTDDRLETFAAQPTPPTPAPAPPTPAPAPAPAPTPAPTPAPAPTPKALSAAELAEALRTLNETDFVNALPEEARAHVVAGRAQAKERREKMLAGLKVATKDAYTEAELQGMTSDQLDKLAKAVGFDPDKAAEPAPEPKIEGARVYDWTGMGGARQPIPAGRNLKDYTPPDPWADALKARKGA